MGDVLRRTDEATMKAVVQERQGSADVLDVHEIPVPEIGDDEGGHAPVTLGAPEALHAHRR